MFSTRLKWKILFFVLSMRPAHEHLSSSSNFCRLISSTLYSNAYLRTRVWTKCNPHNKFFRRKKNWIFFLGYKLPIRVTGLLLLNGCVITSLHSHFGVIVQSPSGGKVPWKKCLNHTKKTCRKKCICNVKKCI